MLIVYKASSEVLPTKQTITVFSDKRITLPMRLAENTMGESFHLTLVTLCLLKGWFTYFPR